MPLHLHKGTPCATNSSPELRGLWYLSYHGMWRSRVWCPGTSHVGLRQINGFSSLLSVFNNENSPSACPSPYSHYDANAQEPHHNSFSNVVSVFSVMPSHVLATRSCVCKVKMKDKDSECQEQAKRSSTFQANCTYFHVSKSKPISWITEPFDSRLLVQLA